MSKKPTEKELAFLKEAAQLLENPGFLVRTAHRIGQPIEYLQGQLPAKVKSWISHATQVSLEKALAAALKTLPQAKGNLSFEAAATKVKWQHRLHVAGSAAAGAVGGFFGAAALPLELPFTTTVMLRSIAQTAQAYGADLKDPNTLLECLYVFTLGSGGKVTNAAETGYYTSRLGFAQMLKGAASYLATHSPEAVLKALEKGSAPLLVRFIATVAARFEITISEKVLSESLPILGAAGGAVLNTVFTQYFNDVAKFHFGIRQLEKNYGEDFIRSLYRTIASG